MNWLRSVRPSSADRCWLGTLALASLLLAGSPAQGAEPDSHHLTVAAKQIPGLIETPDRGHFMDLLRWIEHHSAFSFSVQVMPPARASRMFDSGHFDILIPEPTPSHESAESLGERRLYLFTHATNPKLTDYAGLQGRTLLVIRGFNYDHATVSRYADIEQVDSVTRAVSMLQRQRAYAMLGVEGSTLQAMSDISATDIHYEAAQPVETSGIYLHFGPGVDPAIQRALDEWIRRFHDAQDPGP